MRDQDCTGFVGMVGSGSYTAASDAIVHFNSCSSAVTAWPEVFGSAYTYQISWLQVRAQSRHGMGIGATSRSRGYPSLLSLAFCSNLKD